MLSLEEKYYKPIQIDLERYFDNVFWKDIFEAIEDPYFKLNSNNALIDAIRKGRVFYSNGVFRGRFNMQISRELEKFAEYDGRSKVWRGFPPPDVASAAAVANNKARQLNERIQRIVSDTPSRVEATIDDMKLRIDRVAATLMKAAENDLANVGVNIDSALVPDPDKIKAYRENQKINIKDFTPEYTERLLEMVKDNALAGFNRNEMIRQIQAEYGTTKAKARFLARQETSLFMSAVRKERFEDAGVSLYRWSSSQDSRVVGKPGGQYPNPTDGHGNHFAMNGKICRLDDPMVYARSLEDAKAGKWRSKAELQGGTKHPGEEFGCRCVAVPVIS